MSIKNEPTLGDTMAELHRLVTEFNAVVDALLDTEVCSND